MAGFKDAMFVLTSYPEMTSDTVISRALDFSKELGIRLSAVLPRVDRNCVSHYYAPSERLANIPALVDAAVVRSENNVHELRSRIEKRAKERGIVHEISDVQSHIFPSADLVMPRARLHDLTLLPVPELIGLDELYFESIIFGSGKPTLLLPTAGSSLLGATLLGTVCVAFDYSRPAARALGDAMPILEMAKRVHVLTVRDEKKIDGAVSWGELNAHLLHHGIRAQRDEVRSEGCSIGVTIRQHVETIHADLLVMGAFGHSRMLEFVLGGATRNILNRPPVPVLLSH